MKEILPEEAIILDHAVIIWNIFSELEQTHPSDANDLAEAIHDIQKIISMRICRRLENSRFIIKE